MEILFWIIGIAVAITVHEVAHAYLADRLGDPTPRMEGRLSLNPLKHYDQVGTTLLLVSAFLQFPIVFGWAKPVRFDPYNLKDPRKDAALISLAGPLANILLATVLSIMLRFITPFSPLVYFVSIITFFIKINVSLAIFNLIPVHPLDGGKILVGILPRENAAEIDEFLTRYGTIILLVLIFPLFGGTSLLSIFIMPIVNFILKLFIPGGFI